MATFRGLDGEVTAGGDTVGEVMSFTVTETGDTIETTAQKAAGDARTYKPGLRTFTGTVEVRQDIGDDGQAHLAIGGSIDFILYPYGDNDTHAYIEGTGKITNVETSSQFDNQTVNQTIQFQGTGLRNSGSVVYQVLVSDGGSGDANGAYGLVNGVWTKGSFLIVYDPGEDEWQIVDADDPGAPIILYTGSGTTEGPWTVINWNVDGGEAPAPDVSKNFTPA